MSSYEERDACTRCGETLDPEAVTWLELSFKTNRYSMAGDVPESESQGFFPFGYACAKAVLNAGGKNKQIRRAAR